MYQLFPPAHFFFFFPIFCILERLSRFCLISNHGSFLLCSLFLFYTHQLDLFKRYCVGTRRNFPDFCWCHTVYMVYCLCRLYVILHLMLFWCYWMQVSVQAILQVRIGLDETDNLQESETMYLFVWSFLFNSIFTFSYCDYLHLPGSYMRGGREPE